MSDTEVGTSQTRIWHGAGGDWLCSTNLGTPLGGGAVRSHLAATEACQRDLAATGADLSAYNSTESAADFADLRKVLGIDVWNVYATSYGSYVAQTLMRDHPEGIGHKVRCGSILADATVRFAPIVDMA
jgi:pimeloyl-ACP methyl ester carboxylesterase